MSRQAVSDALAMLKGVEKVGKQAAKLQAELLEKAVEGTVIEAPLKNVRSEVESVLKAVEGTRPEVEGRFSETISKSIDSSAAAAEQVRTFTDSAKQQATDTAQQAQSTAQEAVNKIGGTDFAQQASGAAQMAAATAQSGAQEALNKFNSVAPPTVVDFAQQATGAAQMAAATAQSGAQEAINKFNSVAPAPVVDFATAATAQAAAIFENFQKMALNGPIAATMGSPSAASPVEEEDAVGGEESESDALIREEMAKWEAEVANSAAASPITEMESTGDPETDRLLAEEMAKFNAQAAAAAPPAAAAEPAVEEAFESTGDPETDKILAEELAKFNAAAASAAANTPPNGGPNLDPPKREFSTWALPPTAGSVNRLGLLSHRFNGAFVPVKYPVLNAVVQRQLFQGGRIRGSGCLPSLKSSTCAEFLPGSLLALDLTARLDFQNRFLSDSSNNNVGSPSHKSSTTGVKAPIKLPPKASDLKLKKNRPKLSDVSQEKRVPTGRVERLASYTGLAAGLAVGGLAEMTKRAVGYGGASTSMADSSVLLNPANAERIVKTLCRVRGAALKLGQMLSIADNSLISPELQGIFDRVRQGADFMPFNQTEQTLRAQLGTDWRSKVANFDEKPFAAASIGQVHLAELHSGQQVAIKIQYPGVAEGIDSDINNLVSILDATGLVPEGLFLDELVRVARKELAWEVDYCREKDASNHFRQLLADDPIFYVPQIYEELSSSRVLTSEFLEGVPLDDVSELECLETRNLIGEAILRLTLTELFDHRCMQTDPNWSNFLFWTEKSKIGLIDFGASRYFTTKFVDDYVKIINSAAQGDRDGILHWSKEVGFITGYEAKTLLDAHVDAIMILGEAFQKDAPFDFSNATTLARVTNIIPAILTHRLAAPPEEVYSLHRKMAGVFLLCTRLKCNMNIKHLWDEIWSRYEFGRPDLPEALAQNVGADVKSVSGKR